MVKIQEMKMKGKNGKIRKSVFFVTIPLALIEGFGWKKGDEISCSIIGKDRLRLIKNTPREKTGRVL